MVPKPGQRWRWSGGEKTSGGFEYDLIVEIMPGYQMKCVQVIKSSIGDYVGRTFTYSASWTPSHFELLLDQDKPKD